MKPHDQIADEIIREADNAGVGDFRIPLKAGIAAQLALRDREIEELRSVMKSLLSCAEHWYRRHDPSWDGSAKAWSSIGRARALIAGLTLMTDWQPIETAPLDGREILLLTKVGVTQARFAPGEWHDYPEGREYEGPVWVCCDDQWQIEVEDAGKHGMHHGIATKWMPLPALTAGKS